MKKALTILIFISTALILNADPGDFEITVEIELKNGEKFIAYTTDYGAYFIPHMRDSSDFKESYLRSRGLDCTYYCNDSIIKDIIINIPTCRIKYKDLYVLTDEIPITLSGIKNIKLIEAEYVGYWTYIIESLNCEDTSWIKNQTPLYTLKYEIPFYQESEYYVDLFEETARVKQIIKKLNALQEQEKETRKISQEDINYQIYYDGFNALLKEFRGEKVISIETAAP